MTSLHIDVHHHMVPPDYVAALERFGISEIGGLPFPKWSPQTSLATMDKNGIASAVLSISTPGVYFGEARSARDLARRCNEYAARTVADHPYRFAALASLPLPDVEGALLELEYALDELELDGVILLSSVEGRYPGDPDYREVFDELDKRHAVVFIHPSFDDPQNVDLSRLGVSNALVEAPFDTTRAVASLLYEGILERFQNVRFILAHGGGTVPYLAWKIALQYYAQREKKHVYQALRDFLVLRKGPEEGLDLLRALYYDTALATNPMALGMLAEFVGPSQVLFGTDFPWAKAWMTPILTRGLERFEGFDGAARAAVWGDNALRLFPRLAGTGTPEHPRARFASS